VAHRISYLGCPVVLCWSSLILVHGHNLSPRVREEVANRYRLVLSDHKHLNVFLNRNNEKGSGNLSQTVYQYVKKAVRSGDGMTGSRASSQPIGIRNASIGSFRTPISVAPFPVYALIFCAQPIFVS
jgi:hypothetical protein